MLLAQAGQIVTTFLTAAHQFGTSLAVGFTQLNGWVVARLGVTGQWALWAALALGVFLVVAYATKIVFEFSRRIVFPAVLLSILTLMFFPAWPVWQTLPAYMGAGTLALVARKL